MSNVVNGNKTINPTPLRLIIKFYKQGEWVAQKGVSKYVECPFSHVKYSLSLVDHLCYFYAFPSAHCCLVVTCLEKAYLLALICGV